MNPVLLFSAVCLVVCTLAPSVAACADRHTLHSLVFPRTGDGLAGDIVGVDGDSLTIVVDAVPLRLARTDIARIVVRRSGTRGAGFVTGTIAGLLGWNYGLAVAAGQPASFLHADVYGGDGRTGNPGGVALLGLLSVGVTGGIGHLLDNTQPYSERPFSFTGDGDAQRKAWTELRTWLEKEEQEQRRVRVSLTSASVISTAKNTLVDDFRRAGMQGGSASDVYISSGRLEPAGESQPYDYLDPASDINLIRRLTLTSPLTPSVEVGGSVVWLGEPIVFGGKIRYTGVERYSSYAAGLRQIVDGYGYYATALYNPGLFARSGWDLRLGGGVGLVSSDYRLDAFVYADSTGWSAPQEDEYHHSVSGMRFGMLFLVDLSYRMYDHLSVGLTADYAWTPFTATVPAIQFLGIPERRFSPSNGSIGVQFGFHF